PPTPTLFPYTTLFRSHGEEGVESPGGQEDPDESGGEREQGALREQLAHEPSAPGAERAPDRHLATARGGARQQEIRRVGAGDQRSEEHTSELQSLAYL